MPNPIPERPGLSYPQAKALLEEKGLKRSMRTIYRWVAQGILSVKRVTHGSSILYRDEVEALVAPEDPEEQRLDSARSRRKS